MLRAEIPKLLILLRCIDIVSIKTFKILLAFIHHLDLLFASLNLRAEQSLLTLIHAFEIAVRNNVSLFYSLSLALRVGRSNK